MHRFTEAELAELLPGPWLVAATNFPMWLDGSRRRPRFSYELESASPLVLGDDVSFVDAEGQDQHILGHDRYRDGEFVWRGAGLLRLAASRWSVAGAEEGNQLLVLRFSRTIATPAGIDVIAREGSDLTRLRPRVAHATESLGLSPEEFGSLTWLPID